VVLLRRRRRGEAIPSAATRSCLVVLCLVSSVLAFDREVRLWGRLRGSPCPRVAGVFSSGDLGFLLSSYPLRIEMRGNGRVICAALIDGRVFAEARHRFVGIFHPGSG
jgi:hypothetical protein